jgi:uncharacterized protein (TIGR00375 family)
LKNYIIENCLKIENFKLKIMICDLHLHSKYSRACSASLTLENIDTTCRQKGIDIVGTGDFSFPAWFSSIENELEEIGSSGLFKLKTRNDANVRFMLTNEVSLVYKKNSQTRRLHLCLCSPNLSVVRELNKILDKDFNIRSDGRPILGLSATDLMTILFAIDDRWLVYPAHIWTPWYAIFGSMSGFDRLEECFDQWTDKIFAYESGLSSDPEMNWRLSALDNLTLLSSSDAHSLPNIGREATVFDLKEISYAEIYDTIRQKRNKHSLSTEEQARLSYLDHTIEFYPEEGMYHIDGHRVCGVSMNPAETKKHSGICPVCKKPLVIGVMNRVESLADRPIGFRPDNAADFAKLVELDKIIAESLGVKSRSSKKVQAIYDHLIESVGPELYILEKASLDAVEEASSPLLAEGLRRVRQGELTVKPGFDGQYGELRIFLPDEINKNT